MDKSEKRWKLIKSKPIFESKWMSVYSNDYRLPDGKIGEDYYHLSRPDYVLIVAIDDTNRIVVQKNYRRGVDDFVYELPAGWVDDGETPQKAAERELREETGYVGEADIVGEIYPQPGFSSMKAYGALIRIKRDDKSEQDLGHDEHIDYDLLDLGRVKKMLKEGKIKDMGFLSLLALIENKI